MADESYNVVLEYTDGDLKGMRHYTCCSVPIEDFKKNIKSRLNVIAHHVSNEEAVRLCTSGGRLERAAIIQISKFLNTYCNVHSMPEQED